MEYIITIDNFSGPLDLLLHLIKQSDIDIVDIEIVDITDQYLKYITKNQELNLNIASEYLVMAAELIEMKSKILLPKEENNDEDEYEEDPRQQLINRLLEYESYKEMTPKFKELETSRKDYFTKEPTIPDDILPCKLPNDDLNLESLMDAFNKFLSRKELEKPLNTKIASKEITIQERSHDIKNILKRKNKIEFEELFEYKTRDYVVVTFLSVLDLAKKQELIITQDNNFDKIILQLRGD